MKIAIDISPISKSSTSAHKVRGVGSYINLLVENLPKYDRENEYIFIEDKNFPSNVDLIHYPYFDPFFITLTQKFLKKTVVTVHDLTPIVFKKHFPAGIKGNVRWWIQKQRLNKAHMVIADSESSKKDIVRLLKMEENKVRVVYLAADPVFKKLSNVSGQLSIVSKKYSLPENFLLYVGDATWNKNLPRLVNAVKKTNYKLVLVGKVWAGPISENPNHAWNEDLRKVLLQIKNDRQFIRLGFVPNEDITAIYNLATTLIMPSIYEGFGLPVLEAMSCGCPVITTRGGSLPEVGGDAVLYVDVENESSIADGIKKIFFEPKLRNELSKKGLARAKKFSIQKMVHDLVYAYEEAYR